MKRRALLKHLKDHGCEFLREGSRHSIYWNPSNGKVSPVPQHAEIKNTMARVICKDLEVPAPP